MGKSAHELKQLENTPEFERTILVRRHACHQGLQLASVHGQVLFTAACLAAAWVYLSSVTLASCGMHSNRLFGSNQRVQRQEWLRISNKINKENVQLQLCCDPQAAQFQQRTFKLKVAEEVYNQEARIKVSIRDTEPIDFVDESAVRLCPTLGSLHEGVAVNSWVFRPLCCPSKKSAQHPTLRIESILIFLCRCCWITLTSCSGASPSCCHCRRRKCSPLAAPQAGPATLAAATLQGAAGMGRPLAAGAVSMRAQVSCRAICACSMVAVLQLHVRLKIMWRDRSACYGACGCTSTACVLCHRRIWRGCRWL